MLRARAVRAGAQALPRMRFRLVPQTGQTAFAIRVPLSLTLTSPLGLALLLALHAVELAAPGLRHDGLLHFALVVAAGDVGEDPPGSRVLEPLDPRPRSAQSAQARGAAAQACRYGGNLRAMSPDRAHPDPSPTCASSARPTASPCSSSTTPTSATRCPTR